MLESISFRTRARTIDHLGREQIADCPTAISELWKNAYDAYAEAVALHIYDSEVPIAAIVDDGHGMNRDEFIDKWLVVGTESKTTTGEVPEEDRHGLPYRQKQGQKGIGRLSVAALGPLLLVVSKRRHDPFTAALIDWRLFENPFLFLQDIKIPIVDFNEKEDLFTKLPTLFDGLMTNVWGESGEGADTARNERVSAAWRSFDELEKEEKKPSTRAAIETIVIDTAFEPIHIEQWPLWKGEKEHGTALLIGDLTFDLEAQLDSRANPAEKSAVKQARDRLIQTLSSFTDTFSDTDELREGYGPGPFKYSVTAWEGSLRRPIVTSEREFDHNALEQLEHVLEGEVDEEGLFVGRVKAFGKWLEGEVKIKAEGEVSHHAKSMVGPFHIRLGTFESNVGSSSHAAAVLSDIKEKSALYGGVMVYRNGLRVMPYGREDNDFFEIEKRRSFKAGREFWSNRRTFGRVAITRQGNPNLKDKAGREGIIDNKAAKIFRDLVENILMTAARKYFGSDSDIRKKLLPEIQKNKAKEKAEAEYKKQRASKRKRFSVNLKRFAPQLEVLLSETELLAEQIGSASQPEESEVIHSRQAVGEIKEQLKIFSLGEAPRPLGTLEDAYTAYRMNQKRVAELLAGMEQSLTEAIEAINPRSPKDIAYSELSSHATFLQKRLRGWLKDAKHLLESEQQRVTVLYEDRSKAYHAAMMPLLDDVENERIKLSSALTMFAEQREKADYDNAETFEPYIAALQSLSESIDLETLASYGMAVADEMREELDRLHSLAQLGITVEIIGHEIEGLEVSIAEGLNELPANVKETAAFNNVRVAHDALSDRLRFLSPLKLSGTKLKSNLTGQHIYDYVNHFMSKALVQMQVKLETSERFLKFSVYEQPSRIYPVFINLINNAAYWVNQTSKSDHRILLDIVDDRVIIADDGPGVDEDDLGHLFSLFFTKKVRGGRGVGLYLCRANLAAGGHDIRYATEDKYRLLPGANFVVQFKGAQYE
ncbi:ATP-binding protein [Sulfuriflexus mobilis]|uniref:ATP-binding protein n=1 Tax=Sulfuriflexus mobilis TaxID=1811807 RepID=UPI000F830B29|nr:ATP-binding protein [Sulfuriflexus mobilis]